MATDYDAPRVKDGDDDDVASLQQLQADRARSQSPNVDVGDEVEEESFSLPGADLSDQVLEVVVTPVRDGELQCSRCFLIHQRSAIVQLDPVVCRDCA